MVTLELEAKRGPNRKTANPSGAQIASELATLNDSFAILAKDDERYIQTAGSPSVGYVLEYRDGSEHAHFRAAQEHLPLSTVTEVFQLYAKDDTSWRARVTWAPVSASETRSRPYVAWAITLIALVVVLWVAWRIAA